MRFEKNGRRSAGPNSKHIDSRCFFVKDRIQLEGLDVQHCPTEQMLADFFTKPLQGSLFRKFRDVVMGDRHINSPKEVKPTPSQERVGEHETPENIGDVPDGQTTDGNVSQPQIKASCADILKRPRITEAKVVKTVLKGRKLRPAVTFQK
jgi:hypothetical protein